VVIGREKDIAIRKIKKTFSSFRIGTKFVALAFHVFPEKVAILAEKFIENKVGVTERNQFPGIEDEPVGIVRIFLGNKRIVKETRNVGGSH
jgi:hypothetical protein